MTTEPMSRETWWSAIATLPARMLRAFADSTRDWRRGCGL
jgi:hypothetical protein